MIFIFTTTQNNFSSPWTDIVLGTLDFYLHASFAGNVPLGRALVPHARLWRRVRLDLVPVHLPCAGTKKAARNTGLHVVKLGLRTNNVSASGATRS